MSCLQSLEQQTFKDYECIIIDDSDKCDKDIDEIIKKNKKFIYIKNKRKLGLSKSLNLAIKLSNGKFIARCDSDDTSKKNRLEKQLKFMKNNPSIGVLGSWTCLIDENKKYLGIRKYPESHIDIKKKFQFTNSIAHPSVMIRRSILEGLPFIYREDFKFCEDLELWLRLLSRNVKFHNLNIPLINYSQKTKARCKENWEFNLKARLLHLSAPYTINKLFFLIAIFAWSRTPAWMQYYFYKSVIINKKIDK